MRKVLFIFLLVFLISCTKNDILEINNVKIDIEIAQTDYTRQQGLMFRKEMGKNQGMLFVFDEEKPRSFWMKNTYLALDIIFLDKDMKVVSIVEGMEPCKETECPTYESKVPTMYALEVNSGFVKENNIKEGMTAKL